MQRTERIRRWFGVCGRQAPSPIPAQIPRIELQPGTITLISGPSGAGKSMLLKHLRQSDWIDIAHIDLPNRAVVDCFTGGRLVRVLAMLGKLGLGEVWTYLATPNELSEGQRWRLRLALALWEARKRARTGERAIILADEFASMLDRISARIVCRCLRRAITQERSTAAIVACAREDVYDALRPDLHVSCDFGEVLVNRGNLGQSQNIAIVPNIG